jgi:4-hydroxy-3-methylbut-2-enyl diphosphate reductase IspH
VAAGTVGVTAGTSTPDSVINEVESWLRDFAAREVMSNGHAMEAPSTTQLRAA